MGTADENTTTALPELRTISPKMMSLGERQAEMRNKHNSTAKTMMESSKTKIRGKNASDDSNFASIKTLLDA